ncbi:MAG: hypothetical protein H0X66_12130 [Verrucomicrobia bacterium]|nr:hypothetical protein [Verrucomicrobiota bacterium]
MSKFVLKQYYIVVIFSGFVFGGCESVFFDAKTTARQGIYQQQIRNSDSTARLLGVSDSKKLSLMDPHQAFGVGLDDLRTRRLLSAAKFYGHLYLIMDGTNCVGFAEAKANERRADISNLQKNPLAAKSLEALSVVRDIAERERYEIRYLNIPSVSFFALWLHSESSDRILPLTDFAGALRQKQLYSEQDVINGLLEAAAKAKESEHMYKKPQ